MKAFLLNHLVSIIIYLLAAIGIGIAMWVERQTADEKAAQEKRNKFPRYNVYVDIHCVLGTDNKALAVERYDDECASHNKRVRLYDRGTLIKERRQS